MPESSDTCNLSGIKGLLTRSRHYIPLPMNATPEDVYLVALRVIEELQKAGLEPHVRNYSVLMAARTNTRPELVRVLGDIAKENMPLTQERMDYLYASYISEGQQATIQGIASTARKLFTEMLIALQQLSGSSELVRSKMEECIETLEGDPTIEDLQSIASMIIEGAVHLQQSASGLNRQLVDSQKEIEVLRETLAQATVESERDPLTNLYNRKGFDKRLAERIEEVGEEGMADLTLLMIDVDHFKTFNDTFGHLIGDEVLKLVARTLTDTVKGMDTVARFGGEEFAVILPKTPIGSGMIVAEAVRKAIASRELKRRGTGNSYGVITVSIGVAGFRHRGDTMERLITRADEALYRSKKGGRNRVTQENLSSS